MLSTKENLKQIEMDTIQQEPLLTELTPEAAATVQGGIKFKVVLSSGSLNARSTPRLGNNIIGSYLNGAILDATSIVRGGFRRLTVFETQKLTMGRTIGWVANRYLRRV
ncbi:MAG: SH3 domain-containing protein [Nostoc sp. DedSLP03]|uniref:SH3 domain-containing protein n=1 Tax=Nostoc sp. DedSLP03 TaxID=3075400 RepID=UPI002AD4A04C|nr:SH3 domain-containing protein [Nostoc sp. DedSLP03]MDZ7964450.1 SH3 domain-containing protein [Nostoc sp. DedSLP03]